MWGFHPRTGIKRQSSPLVDSKGVYGGRIVRGDGITMHGATATAIAAGWYTDPTRERQLRWWDGMAWSDATFPPNAPTAEQLPKTADFLQFVSQDTASRPQAVFDPNARTTIMRDSVLKRAAVDNASSHRITKAKTHTRSVWLIAVMPIMQLALALSILAVLPQTDNFRVLFAVIVLPWVWSITLAVRDRNELTAAGHDSTAHWAWMILSPLAYLIGRSVHTRRFAHRGSAPLWVWLGATGGQIATALVLATSVAGLVMSLFSAEVAKNVETSVALQGSTIAVLCPTEAPLAPGSDFQCAATHDTGRTFAVNVRVRDVLGGITWRLSDNVSAVAQGQ